MWWYCGVGWGLNLNYIVSVQLNFVRTVTKNYHNKGHQSQSSIFVKCKSRFRKGVNLALQFKNLKKGILFFLSSLITISICHFFETFTFFHALINQIKNQTFTTEPRLPVPSLSQRWLVLSAVNEILYVFRQSRLRWGGAKYRIAIARANNIIWC